MAKIVPVSGIVIVEPFDKLKKAVEGASPFSQMVASNNLGTIRFSSDEKQYPVGRQVYFGSIYERMMMEGVDVMAMKVDNIVASILE